MIGTAAFVSVAGYVTGTSIVRGTAFARDDPRVTVWYDKIRFSPDLRQVIHVRVQAEEEAAFIRSNMVEFVPADSSVSGGDPLRYRILAIQQSTRANESFDVELEFDACSSFIGQMGAGDVKLAWWDRWFEPRPGEEQHWEGEGDFTLAERDLLEPFKAKFLEALIDDFDGQGFTELNCAMLTLTSLSNSQLKVWSTVAPIYTGIRTSSFLNSGPHAFAYYDDKGGILRLPNGYDVINDPDSRLGLSASEIVDISAMEYPPYEFETVHDLQRRTIFKKKWIDQPGGGLGPIYDRPVAVNDQYAMWNNTMDAKPPSLKALVQKTYSLPLPRFSDGSSSARYNGLYYINYQGVKVGEVPLSLAGNSDGRLYIDPYINFSGDFYDLYLIAQDTGEKVHLLTIPCKHLPWVGDPYTEYCMRSQQWDREETAAQLENQRTQNRVNAATSAANSVTMGAISGNPLGILTGIASAGIGLIGSLFTEKSDADYNSKLQSITEGRAKDAAVSTYQIGSGTALIDYGITVDLWLPENCTTMEQLQTFSKHFGWKYAGLIDGSSVTLPANDTYFVKGTIWSASMHEDTVPICGPRLEKLKDELQTGRRMLQMNS